MDFLFEANEETVKNHKPWGEAKGSALVLENTRLVDQAAIQKALVGTQNKSCDQLPPMFYE